MISILTATYNRASVLPRLHASLLRQTSAKFEWVIVDDGSEDATRDLVVRWKECATRFPITYVKTPNRGKHVALNEAVAVASGNWSFIVDSDDWLPADSVETILDWISDVDGRKDIAGVAGLKALKDSTIPGGPPRIEGSHAEFSNRDRSRHDLMGDKGAEVYRTEILRRFPFPVFAGEKFLHEALAWNRIADAGYRLRWHPVVVYYCEYQEGGLSAATLSNHTDNFRGYSLYMTEAMLQLSGIAKFRALGAYAEVASLKGLGVRQMARETSSSLLQTSAALVARYLYVRLQRRHQPNGP